MPDLPRIWLYNPQNGDDIDGVFANWRVVFPTRETRSFDHITGTELKARYPFLHVVVDGPGVNGRLPEPPSGIVSEAPAMPPAPVVKAPVASASATAGKSEDEQVAELATCPECGKDFMSPRGLRVHVGLSHKK